MNDKIEDVIRDALSSGAIDYLLSSKRDSCGESHTIQTQKGALILSLSREGFVAEIETPEKKNIAINEPEIWSLGHPLKSKIVFYWRVFNAYADGKLEDRLYNPKTTEPNQRYSTTRFARG